MLTFWDHCHPLIARFTCIDCVTRWPEAIPMQDMTAETVALTFATGWIAALWCTFYSFNRSWMPV